MIVSVTLNVALFLGLIWALHEMVEYKNDAERAEMQRNADRVYYKYFYADRIGLLEQYGQEIQVLRAQLQEKQKIIDGIAEAQKRAAEGAEDEMRGGAEYF